MTIINDGAGSGQYGLRKFGAEDCKSRFFTDKELSKLQREARSRAHKLINQVEFVGFAGATINDDGTYEVLVPKIDPENNEVPEAVRDKLREMVTESFEGDAELQRLLGNIKEYTEAKQAKENSSDAPKDTFDFSNVRPIHTYLSGFNGNNGMVDAITHEPDPNGTVKMVDVMVSPTRVPFVTKHTYDQVEKWLKEGGENPILQRINFKA